MKNKSLIIVCIILSIILNFVSSVFATVNTVIDLTRKGSLTLTAYEFINGNENNKKELEGAEFTIYLVASDIDDVSQAESYIANNELTKYTKTSNSTGKVTFSDLELGRYFVVQTNAPKNVLNKVESFLVDIPSTNETGDAWNYDLVVYPKNVTVYGNVELNKKNKNNETMSGVKFKLQKYVDGIWQDYELESEIVTNSEGKIEIHNLEAGKFRLVEIESREGYIVDSSNTQEFDVSLNNTNINLNMINENVKVNKYVLLSNGEYGKHLGVDSKDTVNWKIVSSVPSIISKMKTYTITDVLNTGLDILEDSIKINGVEDEHITLLNNLDDYTIEIENQTMTIIFNPQSLDGYDSIKIEYQTTINNDVEYGQAITNQASVTYTNNIGLDLTEKNTYTTIPSEDSTAEVHTGKLLIYKTDGTNALKGATFKIATSKENAEDGIYVQDSEGNDITATSDENGYVIFQGLKYGEDGANAESASSEYWIVEVQAPSYED